MFYDRTCRGRRMLPGLSHAWSIGGSLYRALGRLDAWHGVESWSEAIDWLLAISSNAPVAEVQFWGHGQWGGLWIDEELLTVEYLQSTHPLHPKLVAFKHRLIPDAKALWWFRSCDTFGTKSGQDFAKAWTDFFQCQAAGHTYTINVLQSGLHRLRYGETPTWSTTEAVEPGLDHATSSHWRAPRTISCLHGRIPSEDSKDDVAT
jgi:hypothetical protein